VNTSSAAGLLSVPAGSAYCATKHGVVTLSECLHHELKMKGAPIGVSVLCPSFVQTGIAESERHRPRELRRPGRPFAPRDENQERAMRDAPLTADEVAEITLAHVLRGSFYILPASDPAGVYSPANYVDASCNLVSRYDWNTRKIRVQAEATENVGEIDAACLDANTHLACSRLRPLLLTPTPKVALDRVRNKNLRPREGKPFSDFSLHARDLRMLETAD